MWHQWSHRPAQQEPLNPLAAITLGSGARWRFSCPPMERHHRGLFHFELPVIKQCIKTSNQSTPTVSLSFEMKDGGNVSAHRGPHLKSTFSILPSQTVTRSSEKEAWLLFGDYLILPGFVMKGWKPLGLQLEDHYSLHLLCTYGRY